jgi:hypothetical protein
VQVGPQANLGARHEQSNGTERNGEPDSKSHWLCLVLFAADIRLAHIPLTETISNFGFAYCRTRALSTEPDDLAVVLLMY